MNNVSVADLMEEMPEPMEQEVVDPEMQMMQEMTEEEALKHLGLERIQIYKDLETILSKRMSWARKIVDYLMENYQEQMPLLMSNGTLENLLDQRILEATELYNTMQINLQKKMNVQNMNFQDRVQAEQEIMEQIMETVNREVLFKPLKL